MRVKKYGIILTCGFALFSMMFGSGNLVFPILVGKVASDHLLSGMLGMILSGVFIPFLGLYAVYLFKGNYGHFFGKLGEKAPLVLGIVLLGLLGPFGVVPRCITVAYGSLWPEVQMALSLELFSLFFCGLVYLAILREGKLIPIVGALLTPILLSSLCIIFFTALRGVSDINWGFSSSTFYYGVVTGYEIMDLLAAFFFAGLILTYLDKSKETLGPRAPLAALLVGGGLLSLVYMGMIVLGGNFADNLSGVSGEKYLSTISHLVLGDKGGVLVGICFFFACMTTAIALVKLSADFAKKNFLKSYSSKWVLLSALIISWIFSTLNFTGIMYILGPIIKTLYPGLILYTVGVLLKLDRKRLRLLFALGLCFGLYTNLF